MPSTADRIRSLIETAGLSRRVLADEVGLDESKLSKSLSGVRRFSSLDLARIADRFDVTVDWLITGDSPPALAMSARVNGSSSNVVAAVDRAKQLSALRSDLTFLGYPQPWVSLETASERGSMVAQGAALAEAAVQRVRDAGLSEVDSDLANVIENVFGADVAIADLGAKFDGLAVSSLEVKLILVATSPLPARQRFTIAHELCHLIVGDDQGLHIDTDVYDASPSGEKDPTEVRANAFASSFLMPETELRGAWGAGRIEASTFERLACDRLVSPSALAYRLFNLGLIDASDRDRYRKITAAEAARVAGVSGTHAMQVTDSSLARLPGLLARDAYLAYETGAATLRPYAQLLGADIGVLRSALESDRQGEGGL